MILLSGILIKTCELLILKFIVLKRGNENWKNFKNFYRPCFQKVLGKSYEKKLRLTKADAQQFASILNENSAAVEKYVVKIKKRA